MKNHCLTNSHFRQGGGIDFYPVKVGILVRYSGASPMGLDGGYLIHDGKIDRIFKHIPQVIAISPDGCHVAFAHARNTKEYYSRKKPYRTLKYINFCEEGKKQ
jgi:hypothetical protein